MRSTTSVSLPSRSSSRLSTPVIGSSTATDSGSTSLSSKEAILTLLGLPIHLCDRSDHSLHTAYQKYKGHLEASQTHDRMVAGGTWTGRKLTSVDLIELFVSKSFWHSHVKKYFGKVSNYPLLVDWLENEPQDRPSDLEVWGVEKSSYTFKDLDGYLIRAAGKGKKKAVSKVAQGNDSDKKKSKKKIVNDVGKKGKKQVV